YLNTTANDAAISPLQWAGRRSDRLLKLFDLTVREHPAVSGDELSQWALPWLKQIAGVMDRERTLRAGTSQASDSDWIQREQNWNALRLKYESAAAPVELLAPRDSL